MMLWFEPQLSYRNCNYCASFPISLKKIPVLCSMLIAWCIKKSIGCWKGQDLDFPHQHWPLHLPFYVVHDENSEGDQLKVWKVHLSISALTSADSVCRNKARRDTLSCSVRLVFVHLQRELRNCAKQTGSSAQKHKCNESLGHKALITKWFPLNTVLSLWILRLPASNRRHTRFFVFCIYAPVLHFLGQEDDHNDKFGQDDQENQDDQDNKDDQDYQDDQDEHDQVEGCGGWDTWLAKHRAEPAAASTCNSSHQ